jgi:hypothetical protein
MQHIVLTLSAERSATRVTLTALPDCVHSEGAMAPERNIILLMWLM